MLCKDDVMGFDVKNNNLNGVTSFWWMPFLILGGSYKVLKLLLASSTYG